MEHRLTAAIAFLSLLGGVALLVWADARPFPDQARASGQVLGVGLLIVAPVLGALALACSRLDEPALLKWGRRTLMATVVFIGIVVLGNIPLV